MDFANFWFQDPAGGGVNPDLIPGSVRLRGNSAGIVRTGAPNSPNSKKWTYSGWYKNGDARDQGQGVLWGCAPASTLYGRIEIRGTNSSGEVYMTNNHSSGGGQAWNCRCSARLRDPGAWYHLVVVYDSAQSTSSNRIKFYINGIQYGSDNNSYPGQNVGGLLNGGYKDACGRGQGAFNSWCMHGYMAEVRVCDNAAYDASYFGEYDDNGMWVPKAPADINVNYGSAGFYLPFPAGAVQTNAAGTSATFTAENINQTDSSSDEYDCMTDSPSNNSGILNGLMPMGDANLSKAALEAVDSSGGGGWIARPCTIPLPQSGKVYWEMKLGGGTSNCFLGMISLEGLKKSQSGTPAQDAGDTFSVRQSDCDPRPSGASTTGPRQGMSYNDIIGFAADCDAGILRIYRNNSLNVEYQTTFDSSKTYFPAFFSTGAGTQTHNFKFSNFRYSPPSGYERLGSVLLSDSLPDTITGSVGGTGNNQGEFVYTGCLPGRIQYGSVNVTYGNRFGQSDVDFLCNGFKIRSNNSNSGTVNWTVTTTHSDGEYSGKKVPFGGKRNSPGNGVPN